MKRILIGVVIAASLPALAAAQGRGGGHGNMGAGPPMSPPGQMGSSGLDRSTLGRDIGDLRGQQGRDLAQEQRSHEIQQHRAMERRTDAAERGALARSYRSAGLDAAAVTALRKGDDAAWKADRDAYRSKFKFDRDAWQDARDMWRAQHPRGTETDWQAARDSWLSDRTGWQSRRDAWIKQQREWAEARQDR